MGVAGWAQGCSGKRGSRGYGGAGRWAGSLGRGGRRAPLQARPCCASAQGLDPRGPCEARENRVSSPRVLSLSLAVVRAAPSSLGMLSGESGTQLSTEPGLGAPDPKEVGTRLEPEQGGLEVCGEQRSRDGLRQDRQDRGRPDGHVCLRRGLACSLLFTLGLAAGGRQSPGREAADAGAAGTKLLTR